MAERRINLAGNPSPDPKMIAWFEANGIDPMSVPVEQEAIVSGAQLTFVSFVMDQDGKRVLEKHGQWFMKVLRTVRLISPPEDHGL